MPFAIGSSSSISFKRPRSFANPPPLLPMARCSTEIVRLEGHKLFGEYKFCGMFGHGPKLVYAAASKAELPWRTTQKFILLLAAIWKIDEESSTTKSERFVYNG